MVVHNLINIDIFTLRSAVSVQNTGNFFNEDLVYLVSRHVKATPIIIMTFKTGMFYHIIFNVQINRVS